MLENGRISVRQLAVFIFLSIFGESVLVYPSLITNMAHQDAWISSLLSVPGGIAVLWLFFQLHRTYPALSLVGISRHILGSWLGTLVSCWYLFYFLISASVYIRVVGDFMTTQLLIYTPYSVINLLFVLLLVGGMLAGLEAVARTSEIMLIIFILFVLILIVCLLPQIDLARLMPIMENGTIPVLHGALYGISYPFGEMSAFLMILPFVTHQSHMKRDMLLASLLAGIVLSMIITISLLVLGPFLTGHSVYTSYILTQKINIGDFLQRIEAIMATAWLITTFVKTMIYFYAFTTGIAQVCRLHNFRPYILPAGMLMFGLSILIAPDIMYYTSTITPYWLDWDLTNAVVIPLVLLGIHAIRQKRRSHVTA